MPEADGLRALAALAVVAYHMNLLPIGWAGVWLFFVLSGFVITWMLLGSEWRFSAARYVEFTRRRAARIWPLYFLYAAISLTVGYALGDTGDLALRALTLLTFTYNFQAATETQFTLFHHLWTISVEQQFYLLYPLVFAAALRWRTMAPIIGLIAASLLLRTIEFAAGDDGGEASKRIFYWSFGQFDGFGVGALIAFHGTAFRRPPVYRAVMGLALAVAATIVAFDVAANTSGRGVLYALAQPFVFPTKLAAFAAMPVTTYVAVVALATAALATAIGPESAARRVLRWPPLVRVGRVSYGVYVWHMFVVAGVFGVFGSSFATAGLPLRLALLLPCAALSIAVAELSYRFYESRFHRRVSIPAHLISSG